jgi:hypothetical protein
MLLKWLQKLALALTLALSPYPFGVVASKEAVSLFEAFTPSGEEAKQPVPLRGKKSPFGVRRAPKG